jgi:hypothetical protein
MDDNIMARLYMYKMDYSQEAIYPGFGKFLKILAIFV